MDKKTVIGILKDDKQDKRSKFSSLLTALNQAPHKNFALTAHYNRSGFSDKNLTSIEYDVKKAFGITAGELKSFVKTEAKEVKASVKEESASEEKEVNQDPERGVKISNSDAKSQDELKLEKYNEQLKAMDTGKADYQDMVSLAYDLAEQLNVELPNKKKTTIVAFLEEQKKSLANEA